MREIYTFELAEHCLKVTSVRINSVLILPDILKICLKFILSLLLKYFIMTGIQTLRPYIYFYFVTYKVQILSSRICPLLFIIYLKTLIFRYNLTKIFKSILSQESAIVNIDNQVLPAHLTVGLIT